MNAGEAIEMQGFKGRSLRKIIPKSGRFYPLQLASSRVVSVYKIKDSRVK
jgi:hypothetical protein